MSNADLTTDAALSDADLREAAQTALTQCLDLGSEETCLIVTDDKRERIGETLYAEASEITDDPVIVRYPPGPQHGAEPPEPVAAGLETADVFLAPTTKSISHTRARGDACEAGARGATLPGIRESVFVTGLDADYETIADHSETLHEQVRDADEIRVTSPQGTDITVEVGDREWLLDTGIVHDDGGFSNLPAGEIFVSPESANGTYVVDGTMRPHGLLEADQQLTFEVEDGYVTDISDDEIRDPDRNGCRGGRAGGVQPRRTRDRHQRRRRRPRRLGVARREGRWHRPPRHRRQRGHRRRNRRAAASRWDSPRADRLRRRRGNRVAAVVVGDRRVTAVGDATSRYTRPFTHSPGKTANERYRHRRHGGSLLSRLFATRRDRPRGAEAGRHRDRPL